MRITINLEDDVAASLKRLGKVRRLKVKALVNLVLRSLKQRKLPIVTQTLPVPPGQRRTPGVEARHELIE